MAEPRTAPAKPAAKKVSNTRSAKVNLVRRSRSLYWYLGFGVGGGDSGVKGVAEELVGSACPGLGLMCGLGSSVRGMKGVVERKVGEVGNDDEVDGRAVGGGIGFGFVEAGFKGERGYAPELLGDQKEFSASELCWRRGRLDSEVLRALCGRGAGGKLRFQKA